ncbi:MAG TPA: hypothetical protein HPQ04_07970 [Rhodospirillaceae bacterium]|nr:hypothetical protein [Rhodospirillaceae bacterium]
MHGQHPKYLWNACFRSDRLETQIRELQLVNPPDRKLKLVFEHIRILRDVHTEINWRQAVSGAFQQLDHLIVATTSCQRHMTEFSQATPARYRRLEDDIQAVAAAIDWFLSELKSFRQSLDLSPKEKENRFQKLSKKLANALPQLNEYINNYDFLCRNRDAMALTLLLNDSAALGTARDAIELWEGVFSAEFPKRADKVYTFNYISMRLHLGGIESATKRIRTTVMHDRYVFRSADIDRFVRNVAVGMNYLKAFRDAINKLQRPDLYRRSLYGK